MPKARNIIKWCAFSLTIINFSTNGTCNNLILANCVTQSNIYCHSGKTDWWNQAGSALGEWVEKLRKTSCSRLWWGPKHNSQLQKLSILEFHKVYCSFPWYSLIYCAAALRIYPVRASAYSYISAHGWSNSGFQTLTSTNPRISSICDLTFRKI